MKVLVTGAHGFIGKNLLVHLIGRKNVEVITFTRQNDVRELPNLVKKIDFVFHLAGINRPMNEEGFQEGNVFLTAALCEAIASTRSKIPIVYTSSIQAKLDNPYGQSKFSAEQELTDFANRTKSPVYIFRLPNVFGKWCKPNYNSAVATFCHNISRDLPIQINDCSSKLRLVYVDDVVKHFISVMNGETLRSGFYDISPVYEVTVGELAEKIRTYKNSRNTLVTEKVGGGFDRALYSTYLSYLKPDQFGYDLCKHEDSRGVFVEMLKTKDSGQFSFFTAHPGVTRGGHYHHTKTEKFLVVKGEALFKFRHILTDEYFELKVSGCSPRVVETVPGWTHDITNISNDELVVMLWANEVFDSENPDTYPSPI